MSAERADAEFSRLIRGDDIGKTEHEIELTATPEERVALARRLSLVSLDRLSAEARTKRIGSGDEVCLVVQFRADVVQSCVITLDPFPAHIEESFELILLPEGEVARETKEVVVAHDGDEPPEPFHEGAFDVGEAVAEHLALALDPYPRKPGAALGDALDAAGKSAGEGGERPFDVLRRLKEGA